MTAYAAPRNVAAMSTPNLRCNALSIAVSDLDRAIGFFRLCGIPFPDADGGPHVECPLPGGFKIMLDAEASISGFHPGWSAPSGSSRSSLAVECDTPAEVDAAYQRVVDAGFESELEPFDAVWGQRYAVVRDPDGNTVDFYAAAG